MNDCSNQSISFQNLYLPLSSKAQNLTHFALQFNAVFYFLPVQSKLLYTQCCPADPDDRARGVIESGG